MRTVEKSCLMKIKCWTVYICLAAFYRDFQAWVWSSLLRSEHANQGQVKPSYSQRALHTIVSKLLNWTQAGEIWIRLVSFALFLSLIVLYMKFTECLQVHGYILGRCRLWRLGSRAPRTSQNESSNNDFATCMLWSCPS